MITPVWIFHTWDNELIFDHYRNVCKQFAGPWNENVDQTNDVLRCNVLLEVSSFQQYKARPDEQPVPGVEKLHWMKIFFKEIYKFSSKICWKSEWSNITITVYQIKDFDTTKRTDDTLIFEFHHHRKAILN